MIDLDHPAELTQADSQGWFDRAAQIAERPAAAAQRVATCLAETGLANLANAADQHVVLVLPPELLGLGEAAAALSDQAGHPLALCPARVEVSKRPAARLHLLPKSLSLALAGSCRDDMQDEVMALATATVNLAPYVQGADHPAFALSLLLGVLAAARRQPGLSAANVSPPFSSLDAAAGHLARCRPETPSRDNPAKQLALRLYEQIPIFWGSGLAAGVARDWAMRYLWYAEAVALATEIDELSRLLVMARLPRFWPNAAVFVEVAGQPPAPDGSHTAATCLRH
jgi:hypothetical protein